MFEPTYIPDNMVSTYLAASNTMCIPYREILTSGTAMLAMSYGLPLISIKRGFLEDVVSKSTGLLNEPNNDSELKEAMQNVIHIDWSAKDILEHAKKFTFYDAARIFKSELPVSSA
jgi:glycogen synthase